MTAPFYQWQTIMDPIKKYIVRFGQQLWPFIKKKLPNFDCPKILTKDKKIYLKTFDKILI